MTHPDHAPYVQRIGTLAGYPVEILSLDAAAHPERPAPRMQLNSAKAWARVGDAPWTRTGRSTARLRQWLDPEGSPWTVSDLVAILEAAEMPDLEDADWPDGPLWEALPVARRRAAERYAREVTP